MHGETHGFEIAVNWQATHRWTLSPGYAFEEIHMHLAPTSQDTTSVDGAEGSSPDQFRTTSVTFCSVARPELGYIRVFCRTASPTRANLLIRGSTRDCPGTSENVPP